MVFTNEKIKLIEKAMELIERVFRIIQTEDERDKKWHEPNQKKERENEKNVRD